MIEREALVLNSGIPGPVGRARRTRSGAVTTRTPGPMHGIARVNHHRIRREAQTIVANRNGNRGRTCQIWEENQNRSDNRHHYRNA